MCSIASKAASVHFPSLCNYFKVTWAFDASPHVHQAVRALLVNAVAQASIGMDSADSMASGSMTA
jgi:hypothetical protein